MPAPEATPTPRPTPTPIPNAPRNENVEALNAAQAALGEMKFGLAPLLLLDETTIEIREGAEGPLAHMNYPEQPADPTRWESVDSFGSAYAVRAIMLNSAHVSRVTLGEFDVSASVENVAEAVGHTAVWVTFVDGSRATVDLTPLSTNFAARHTPDRMLIDNTQIEAEFNKRRNGIGLDQLQPMVIVREEGQLYYLLAKVLVNYDTYEFLLQLYPAQPADPMRPMNLSPGMIASVEIDRTEFEKLQQLLLDTGQTVFEEHPELLAYKGNPDDAMATVMDDHLHLLWHLITKFQGQPPDPNRPTPTPEPTNTPAPTATPTPTATPRKMPLQTS